MRAAKERLNKLCCLSLSNGDSREVAVELMQKGIKLDRLRGLLSKIEPDLYQNINPTAPVNENTPKTYQAHRL